MSNSLVSILVPTFEPSPQHLRAALDSVLAQTEQRFSVLIHDDASKTDVESIVAPYLSDERFAFQKSTKRLGIGGNWNACVSASHFPLPASRYIQFLFQDDLWHSHYLESCINVLEQNSDIGFVSANHIYSFEGELSTKEAYEYLKNFKENLSPGKHDGQTFLREWIEQELHPNMIGEPSFVMLRRSAVKDVGIFREDMPQFLDVEYWLRCLQKTNWYFLKNHLGTFRVHKAGASAQNDARGAGMYGRLRCFEILLKSTNDPKLRRAIEEARNRALTVMAKKFLKRLRKKKTLTTKGSGALRRLCLRHPLITGRALLRALAQNPNDL